MKKQLLLLAAVACGFTSFAQIPTSGLQAYYSFDSDMTSDKTANVKSLNTKGTTHNFSISNTGKFGSSLLALPFGNVETLYRNDGDFLWTNTFSISAWINMDSVTPSDYAMIVCNRRNQSISVYNNMALLYNNITKKIQLVISDVDLTAPNTLNAGWNHIVATYNTGVGKIYINGVLAATSNTLPSSISYLEPSTSSLTGVLQIGNVAGINNHSFNNLIDEVALYNTVLDSTAVGKIYTATNNNLAGVTQLWKKVVDMGTTPFTEISAKDSTFIGGIANGENYVIDLATLSTSQEFYQPNVATATNISISNNGRALVQNNTNLYYFSGLGGYNNITGIEATSSALNSTRPYAVGASNQGIYKYVGANWVGINTTQIASKIAVSNDSAIFILNATGKPAIATAPNYTFSFIDSLTFNSVTIKDANIAYATTTNGSVYKYNNGIWMMLTSTPAISKVSVAADGTLFGINNGNILRFYPAVSTGINEVVKSLNFSVYPNPANSIVTINTQENIKEITMFNLLGEVVLTETVKNTINVSNINNGIYLLQVKTTNGAIGTKKIIVNN
jgi:hypothetical protein